MGVAHAGAAAPQAWAARACARAEPMQATHANEGFVEDLGQVHRSRAARLRAPAKAGKSSW